MRVQRLLELIDRIGIRLLEIAVFTLAEPVPAHLDRRPEQAVVRIERAELRRVGLGDQLRQQRTAEVVDLGGDRIPVSGVDSFLKLVVSHQNNRASRTSAGSSRSSRNFLRSSPPAYPVSLPFFPTTR